MVAAAELTALERDGYIVQPHALDPDRVHALRQAFDAAPAEGGTQHVRIEPGIPSYETWLELRQHETVHALAATVLDRAFEVRDLHGRNPLPGFGQQGLHADWMPRASGEPYYVVTALFMLDDFTPDNGATRVVPGTHRQMATVPKSFAQPLAHHPDEKLVTGKAGSLLLMNGHLWHSGTRNTSNGPRRVVQMVIAATQAV